jgi:hypothetical protein
LENKQQTRNAGKEKRKDRKKITAKKIIKKFDKQAETIIKGHKV